MSSEAVRKRTILACDDDPEILLYYTHVLRIADITVVPVTSGEQCLDAVKTRAFDAIILDVNLGGISGLEVCSRLKEDPATQPVPVLLVTAALADVRGRVIGFEVGADDFLVKPVLADELIVRMKTLLRTRDLQERLVMEQQTKAILREEARHSARLRIANEELQNFTYAVSHDLRVPLVNVKGFAAELRSELAVVSSVLEKVLPHLDDVTKDKLTRALGEEIPEALRFIETSVSRMDKLINAVLTLSRLGRRPLKPEILDMGELVENLLKNLAFKLEERHVKVTVGPLPGVVADRTSMEMIVGNILSNAVNYLDAGRPGEIEVTGAAEAGETVFGIRDNGRGISPADTGKLFQLFRRLGTQDVPGEGVGLSYVRTLVHRHGGRIWCDSKPGVGSTFSFAIPAAVPGEEVRVEAGKGPGTQKL